jgi:RNA-splicing ligase RtcB
MNSALIAVQVQALGNLHSIEAKNAASPRTVEEIQAAYKLVDEVTQGGMRF